MNQYIITEELLQPIEETAYPVSSEERQRLSEYARSHPYNPQAEREKQCGTCKHKGTRACLSHGYDDVPISCSYKLGINAEEAMKNLNGTFIDVWTPEHDKQVMEKVLNEMLASLQNEGMAVWEERGYIRFIQSFRKGGE